MFVTKNFGVETAPCLLPKISRVEVTPSITSVESSEQFWCKIRQILRICEPCGSILFAMHNRHQHKTDSSRAKANVSGPCCFAVTF